MIERILTIYTLILGISALLIVSCGTTREDSLEASEAQATDSISANASWIEVDTAVSVVTWIGSKPTGQHNGIIPVKNGKIALYKDQLVGGELTIDVSRIKVMDLRDNMEKNAKLRNHLLSEDFFHADSFPVASFEITSVVPYDSTLLPKDTVQIDSEYQPGQLSNFMVDDPSHMITGNLTMRGTTKSITFPAKVSASINLWTAEAQFNLDRTDWQLSYHDESRVIDKAKDQFIYNNVNTGFYIEVPLTDD